ATHRALRAKQARARFAPSRSGSTSQLQQRFAGIVATDQGGRGGGCKRTPRWQRCLLGERSFGAWSQTFWSAGLRRRSKIGQLSTSWTGSKCEQPCRRTRFRGLNRRHRSGGCISCHLARVFVALPSLICVTLPESHVSSA